MNAFETEVHRRLTLYPPETVFLAAVSGGADSTAMLSALAVIRDEKLNTGSLILRCLHVEHGIRPQEESRSDALAVKRLCRDIKVPCKTVFIPQGKIALAASKFKLGIEGAARFYRYRILNNELRRFGEGNPCVILTAHTRDDLLETMLMRFLRGAGPAGLASLGVQSFTSGGGRILRPLLGLGRADVVSYLEEKGLSYCVDSTNDDLRYLRNRIRHKLIPLLDADFPFWRNALLFSGETQRLTAEFLSFEAGSRLLWEKTAGGLQIPLEAFFREPAILREESFFKAVDKLEAENIFPAKPPRRASLRRFLCGPENAGDLGPVRAEKRQGYLFLKPAPKPEFSGGFSLLIKESGSYNLKDRFHIELVKFEEAELIQESGTAAVVCFLARLPLVLRMEKGILAAGQKHCFSAMLKNVKEYAGNIIAAEDASGIAALIGINRAKPSLLFAREKSSRGSNEQAHLFYKVIFGGKNV